jgi:hypothetical protein
LRGWNELLAFLFPPFLASFLFSSFFSLWIYDSEIIQTHLKLCHFFMDVLCLFWDFHLVTGSRSGGISLHYNTLLCQICQFGYLQNGGSQRKFWNDLSDLLCKHYEEKKIRFVTNASFGTNAALKIKSCRVWYWSL